MLQTLSDEQKRELLEQTQTVAIVGLSPKPQRPSHRIGKFLQDCSYKIVPVRPGVKVLLGEPVFSALDEIPFKVDLVNVFRASQHVPEIVDQCIECNIKAIWLQEDVIHNEAAERAQKAGISVIMDECIYKEIVRLGIERTKTVN
ncbi:MAG: CoA-binding protein [Pseudomonadota bacterium]